MRKVIIAKFLSFAAVLLFATGLQAQDFGCPAEPEPSCANTGSRAYSCAAAADCTQAAPARKVVYERVTFTEEARPSEYVMEETYREKPSIPVVYEETERQRMFRNRAPEAGVAAETSVKNDRDGSIFGGGPCKTCTKDGSIFGGGPCKTCTKDGSIFGGGPCKTCTKDGSIFGGGPCVNCKKPKPVCNPKYIQNYVVYDDNLYTAVHHECQDLAPLELAWVDFRLKNGMNDKSYSRKLGKYRFRIFGCRRDSKNALLNEGRITEKDMRFGEIFDDVTSDCYKIVKIPDDLCLNQDAPLPEYVLTAEVTDMFMNVCDEYNWEEAAKSGQRNGSAEMTVVWRLLDLTKTNVYWKGTSVGYAELEEGETNGEMVLIERAFADAVDNLRNLPDFEDQLAKRVSPEEMARQRQALIELQRRTNPAKCQFAEPVILENAGTVSGGYGLVEGGQTFVPQPSSTSDASSYSGDRLCIIERSDYDNMGPENVYKVRASVVSVANAKGKKGAGLLISEQFVMTSADLIEKDTNEYYLETINGKKLKAKAFRVNPKRNTALLILDQPTEYTPLALNLELPPVGKGKYLTWGIMDFDNGEGYLENSGTVSGYRYAKDGTAEIVIDTFVQDAALGSTLIDERGRIVGIAHSGRYTESGPDLFLPIETAMKSLGVEICGKSFPQAKPRPKKSWRKPVAQYIDTPVAKAPEVMEKKERK